MRVLLTGASGFVGSHILDALNAAGINSTILLRPNSSRVFISSHLQEVEIRTGAVTEPASLGPALEGITDVIHCAGCTRASRTSEFYEHNYSGTHNVVEALNARVGQVQRLVHISSLAVTGPAGASRPAREEDPPRPVSDYGRSKLQAELEVRERSRAPFTIIRPPAVYGPRDRGFLSMFRAVKRHVLPRPSASQFLSLVYVKDLAQAVVGCLRSPVAIGKTYFVASPELVTARMMAEMIAAEMNHWTLPCPLPAAVLWPVCLIQEVVARLTGRPTLLNLQKFAELRAPGWVCDSSALKRDLGFECQTGLKKGVAETLRWYGENRWI